MSAEAGVQQERLPRPKLIELTTADFPIVEGEVDGYKTIELPEELRKLFDEQGVAVVRINSGELAARLPDYGGRASGNYSLLPHQDHVDPGHDERRFLVLSKTDEGARGAATIVMTIEQARMLLPVTEAYFKSRRQELEREYDDRFLITEEQYNRCLDAQEGYEQVIGEMLGADHSPLRELRVRSALLGYIIRGRHADEIAGDELFEKLAAAAPGQFLIENWDQPSVLIIDNAVVFHMRCGGNNPPLKRNFATVGAR